MTVEHNPLESFIKRPPAFATVVTIVASIFVVGVVYTGLKDAQVALTTKIQDIQTEISGLNGKNDLNAKGLTDLATVVNLIGSRVDAQAARISSMDSEFATMQSEVRQALRDQVATDKVILDKLGILETSVAGMRADMNWLARIPIPPGTLGGRSADLPAGPR